MAGNSFGNIFRLTSFGESHGKAIGGIIDGCPSNISINFKKIQYELNRRRPGQSKITTDRNEADEVEFLSGIFEGRTLGTPIAFIIKNDDQRSNDYDHLKEVYRPSHADWTYDQKYQVRDHRGGGRASARETASRVVAGAIAKQVLGQLGITVHACVSSIGSVSMKDWYNFNSDLVEENLVRCPDPQVAAEMLRLVETVKEQKDSIGGTIACVIKGAPAGLGEPVFDKLHAEIGKAMLSINAVKGIEFGSGFSASEMYGSQHNEKVSESGVQLTNHAGGILGGISNGQPICFRVAFKPVATIGKEQTALSTSGETVKLEATGRHDPCVVPRAVPIVEAMASMVMLDMVLRNKSTQI